MEAGTRHVAGAMKQQNKTHKSRCRSKGQLNTANKGRVEGVKAAGKHKMQLNRDARRLQTTQIRKTKREHALAEKRSLGTSTQPPLLLVFVALQGIPPAGDNR
jgi:pre-rRNA-processing protein TSR1